MASSMGIDMIVSITGHRPDKLGGYKIPNPIYNSVIAGLDAAFEKLKPDFVITGMALGVDQWAAELCIKKKIKFIAAIPFNGQESVWPLHAQTKYSDILSKAHGAYVISPGAYSSQKMHARNEWMVDSSDVLAAVWDGTPGGTGSCVEYAKTKGRKIHWVQFEGASNKEKATTVEVVPAPAPKVILGMGVEAHFKKNEASKFLEQIKDKAKKQAEEFKKKMQEVKDDQGTKSKAAKIPEGVSGQLLHLLKKFKESPKSLTAKEEATLASFFQEVSETKSKEKESKKGNKVEAHTYKRIVDLDD